MNDYSERGDNELLLASRSGDSFAEEQLILRYSRLVRMCARPYFLVGGDSEDLLQEGMLGLLSAIREYDLVQSTSFKTYAEVCVRRRLLTAIRSASRMKHKPLNDGVSFDELYLDEKRGFAREFRRSPEEHVIEQERADEVFRVLPRNLSRLEAMILELYLNGLSYDEMADRVGRPVKSVDNAVQRIRRKLARFPHGEIS